MSKTFKDKPTKYIIEDSKRKPKEGKRFISTKGRLQKNIKKNIEDYYI